MTIDMNIIKEMIRQELLKEINPGHDARGRWAKKGKATTYSLTKNAEDDVGEDSDLEVPARGSITAKGKISSKFGMNTGDPDKNCGRLTIDGSPKKKTRSCKDYPKDYWDEGQEVDEKLSTPGRVQQMKDTEKRNRHKNKNDLVPRSIDSPSVRQDKLFGDQALYALSRGIMQELDDEEGEDEFPVWDSDGKLTMKSTELEEKLLEPADEIYIKELIKTNVKQALQQTKTQANKQGVGCGWKEIMRALMDIETAQKGHKEPK